MQKPIEHYEKSIIINGKQARYYDFQELVGTDSNSLADKPTLHFYGGNGFPVGVYEPLITELSQHFHVISLAMRGYWYDLPAAKVLSREQDAEYLIDFIEQTQSQPIIGVGHSQGATATAIAIAKRPDLFSKLYLLDPVTFTKAQTLLYNRLPKRILMTQEPFKSTNVKQKDWGNIEDYYQHLRQHRAFKRISDDNLLIFAKNSLIKKDDNQDENDKSGYELLFKPKQELASYFGTPYITDALKTLNNNKTPYHIILAKPSVFNSKKVRKSWQGIVPSDQITILSDYGHLLPMEAPKDCSELIEKIDNARR